MDNLRILLVDDHDMFREGLKMLVSAQPDMEVIGEAKDGRIAVALAQQLQPDIVVMDVTMPVLNGLKATEKLKALCPNLKILTLTRHTDDAYLQQLLKMGASGYVLKQSASSELIRAIRTVYMGNTYIDPALTERVISNFVSARPARGAPASKDLSGREEEVLRFIAWGYSNKEIAARLSLSVKTVEAHKTNAMQKTGMKSRIDIVRYALLQEWLQDT
ncbi:response regulator transcription factor [soil metagenome]